MKLFIHFWLATYTGETETMCLKFSCKLETYFFYFSFLFLLFIYLFIYLFLFIYLCFVFLFFFLGGIRILLMDTLRGRTTPWKTEHKADAKMHDSM